MAEAEKRKFIIACQSDLQAKAMALTISKSISKAVVILAKDGIEAQSKIENDPPLVLLISHDLPKKNALQLVEWVLNHKSVANLSVIILAPIPDQEHFVDEVVTGRVQFFNNYKDEILLIRAVSKALNFSVDQEDREFKLRFLTPGDRLIHEGEKAETVFIVRTGTLAAKITRGNEIITLGKVNTGEFVGEMAYINGEPRSADVIAETPCELIEIPIDHLDHLLFQKPAWSKALMRTLSKRIKLSNQAK